MATCLCDAFYADVAQATVEVLEHVGCEVEFPEGQTCCGQPAFNGGDWTASRKVVRHTVNVFKGDKPVIVPSGSCAAMVFHGAPLEFENEPDLPQINALGNRTWELVDFLVNGLGLESWPSKLNAKIALHHSCHTRGTQSGPAMEKLLGSIDGVELVSVSEPEQCCGFGGTFAVTFPHISKSMGDLKIQNMVAAQPDLIVSGDMSCLMHQKGLAEKEETPYPVKHVAQVLRDALNLN
ncbi:MAG: (Fe-S)-binding protein [Verrucomicrobia bacterium]|nr:(Fe-S)-binding protein [Verrucomicrobiota bacterium]